MSEARSRRDKLIGFAVLAVVVFLVLSRCEEKRHQSDFRVAKDCTDTRSSYHSQRSPDGTLSDEQLKAIIAECMEMDVRANNSN